MTIEDIEIEIRKHRDLWEAHEKAKHENAAQAQMHWFAMLAAKNRLRAAKEAEADLSQVD